MAQGGEGSTVGERDGDGASLAGNLAGAAALGVDAVLDIRTRGLEAAGALVDRIVRAVDGDSDAAPGTGNGASRSGASGDGPSMSRSRSRPRRDPGADAVDDLLALWAELLQRGFEAVEDVLSTAAAPAGSAGAAGGDGDGRADGDGRDDRDGRGGPEPADTAAPRSRARDNGDRGNGDTPAPARDTGAGSDGDRSAAVEDRLRAVARDVRRALLAEIPDAEPHDWLYRLVRSYPSRPGKAIRPALCLATCRAFGGGDDDAMAPAVAIEMLHNAFLVHDDIADGSARRRGRPTLPTEFGAGLALNAGDALAVLANRLLRRHARDLDADLADRLLDEFDTMTLRTLEGQARELGWQRDATADLVPEDYLDLIMHKTCWYTTIHPLRVGALVGTGGSADLRPMVRFGFHLGAAFQIQDDLLNLVGDERLYGKEINGDLREGKRTLVLIHLAHEARGADRTTVDRYLHLSPGERTPGVIADIRALIDAYGSIEFTRAYAAGIAGAADDAFDEAFASAQPGPDTDFVRDLVPYMLGRGR